MARAGLIAALAIAAAGCRAAAADGGSAAAGSAAAGSAAPPATATPHAETTVGAVMTHIRVTPPGEWQRLPGVETAAAAAAGEIKAATTEIEAWGDPAAGCYAIAIDARGAIAESVDASLSRLGAALAPLGVDAKAMPKAVKDVADVELAIATGALTGTARIRMLRGPDRRPQGAALACAGNPREPARCKLQCDALFAQMAPPVGAP
jgi:hypothetical protein